MVLLSVIIHMGLNTRKKREAVDQGIIIINIREIRESMGQCIIIIKIILKDHGPQKNVIGKFIHVQL